MGSVFVLRLLLLLGIAIGSGACASNAPLRSQASSDPESLTLIVSELRMYLALDTYRFPRPRTVDGRDALAVVLWKLDRLQRESAADGDVLPTPAWTSTDLVVEYARAGALERMRRYGEAAEAYARVADHGSLLMQSARDAERTARRFAALARADRDDLDLVAIEARIAAWQHRATAERGTRWESLALEEAETWEMLRVEWLAAHDERPRAIAACGRLLDRHRHSKRASTHWIRLGDLYADAARERQMRERARLVAPDPQDYDALLERAFAAYERAADSRHAPLREQADARIEALLAWHEGGIRDAR